MNGFPEGWRHECLLPIASQESFEESTDSNSEMIGWTLEILQGGDP